VPREFAPGAIRVEPRLVVAVKFVNRTRDGVLRHPSFDGICEGTVPELVVIERPLSTGRADLLLDGSSVWRRILAAIEELQA
jgi:hypothetical protein